jgi:hypothetical protein
MAEPQKQRITDEQAERIDAFLGDGTYDKWSELDWEAQTQLHRAKRIDNALWRLDHNLSVLSPYGTDWVEKLKNDLDWGMDLIKENKFPDPAQFKPLLEIFPVALDTADLKMDDAEAIPTIWLVSGAVGLPVVGFTVAVARLHNDLLELDKALGEALAEQVEAGIKSLLGVAITTVGLMLPGVGLLAKGGMTVAEVLLSGPTTVAGGTKYAKFAAESVEMVEKAGKTVHHVANVGGKTLAVTGFYFDYAEVQHAKGNVKKVKELIEKANKEYNELKGKLAHAATVYQRLQHFLETSAEPMRKAIDDKQRERDDLIQRHAYSLVKPISWRIVDDYSRFTR